MTISISRAASAEIESTRREAMENLVKRLVLGALLVAALAVPVHPQVRVNVDIGIHLPSPPPLVVVPGTPVYYAGLLRSARPRERLLLRPSVLGLRQRWMVRRADLARSVGGRAARLRAGADSPDPRPLLPCPSSDLEGVAAGWAAAVGVTLRARVARRSPRAQLARARGALGSG